MTLHNITLVCSLSVLLAACGSSDSDGTDTSTSGAGAAVGGAVITNASPTVSGVTINSTASGNPTPGSVLTAIYVYNDADNDAEGATFFQWYRNGVAIAGATAKDYLVVAADQGQTLSVEVVPVALSGNNNDTVAVNSDSSGSLGVVSVPANAAPTAASISVNGTPIVGQTLTGAYAYNDADGNAEGTSTFRWLRNGAPITGQTTNSYTLVAADAGKTIIFAVTPIASAGTVSGTEAQSSAVSVTSPNTAPTASSVSVIGADASQMAGVGTTLTGTYTFNDAEGDAQGTSTYRWLRDGTAIPGAIDITYTVSATDINTSLTFAVTPIASTGASTGSEVVSSVLVTAINGLKCPAYHDGSFMDDFVIAATADRPWIPSTTIAMTVDQIAAEFNAARANDPTTKELLKMPSQAVWDSYDTQQKMLYMVNSERCARGLLPFEGTDPRMFNTALDWSDSLTVNDYDTTNAVVFINHGSGNNSIPSRFSSAGVDTNSGGNADFMPYSENLATFQAGSTAGYPTNFESEMLSVYHWMYNDKAATAGTYGHRKFILIDGLSNTNDHGSANSEGLFGAALTTRQDTHVSGGNTFMVTNTTTVMHAFNPNASYVPVAGDTITPAPEINGPISQADCAGGAFFPGLPGDFGTCD